MERCEHQTANRCSKLTAAARSAAASAPDSGGSDGQGCERAGEAPRSTDSVRVRVVSLLLRYGKCTWADVPLKFRPALRLPPSLRAVADPTARAASSPERRRDQAFPSRSYPGCPARCRFTSTAATSPSAARPVGRRRRCELWQSRRQGLPACRSGGAIQRSKRPICVAIPIALQASGFQTGCFAETPSAAAGRLPASLRTLADPLAGVRPLHLVSCASVTSLMLCRLHSCSEQPEPPYYC